MKNYYVLLHLAHSREVPADLAQIIAERLGLSAQAYDPEMVEVRGPVPASAGLRISYWQSVPSARS